MGTCCFCGKPTEYAHNYCSWECQVELARKEGGRVITPNNLPVRCITAKGDMLEIENGDHPTYMFPVDVEYVGNNAEGVFSMIDCDGKKVDMGEGWVEAQKIQEHALIYTDGCVALTLYECCYALWHLRDGRIMSSSKTSLWKEEDWKLTQGTLEKLRTLPIGVEAKANG